jgi:hypothetical protein
MMMNPPGDFRIVEDCLHLEYNAAIAGCNGGKTWPAAKLPAELKRRAF